MASLFFSPIQLLFIMHETNLRFLHVASRLMRFSTGILSRRFDPFRWHTTCTICDCGIRLAYPYRPLIYINYRSPVTLIYAPKKIQSFIIHLTYDGE